MKRDRVQGGLCLAFRVETIFVIAREAAGTLVC